MNHKGVDSSHAKMQQQAEIAISDLPVIPALFNAFIPNVSFLQNITSVYNHDESQVQCVYPYK